MHLYGTKQSGALISFGASRHCYNTGDGVGWGWLFPSIVEKTEKGNGSQELLIPPLKLTHCVTWGCHITSQRLCFACTLLRHLKKLSVNSGETTGYSGEILLLKSQNEFSVLE